MFGVLKSRPPQAERSPYPRSSARITITFGFLCRCCAKSAAARCAQTGRPPQNLSPADWFFADHQLPRLVRHFHVDFRFLSSISPGSRTRSAEQWYVVALIIGGFILRRRDFISTSAAAAALNAQTAPRRHVESIVTISRQPEYYHGWPTLARRRNGRAGGGILRRPRCPRLSVRPGGVDTIARWRPNLELARGAAGFADRRPRFRCIRNAIGIVAGHDLHLARVRNGLKGRVRLDRRKAGALAGRQPAHHPGTAIRTCSTPGCCAPSTEA